MIRIDAVWLSAQKITQKLAVSRPTLYKWKNQLLGREVPISMKLHNDSQPDPERLDLEQQVEALQRDIRKLQLEHDLLKKANELLKKGLGVHLPLLINRKNTVLVAVLAPRHCLRFHSVHLFVSWTLCLPLTRRIQDDFASCLR